MTVWISDHLINLQDGEIIFRDSPGDAVLVVGHAAVQESIKVGVFDRVHWSYAWLNFLEQECGGNFSVVDLKHLVTRNEGSSRLIIITSSATADKPSKLALLHLEQFVRHGGCVVLETPTPAWRYLSGGKLGKNSINVNASGARSLLLHCNRMPHQPQETQPRQGELQLAEAPLFSYVYPTEGLDSDTSNQGHILDVPAMWQRKLGQGWVVTLTFDAGMYLQALQQGVPTIGWKVNEISGLLPGIVESQDLCLSRDIVDNNLPYADMFEDWFADYCDGALEAWPRWWRFPYAYDGVLALTHDEEKLGPMICKHMWELEEEEQVPSTVFAICSNDHDGQRWGEFQEPYSLIAQKGQPSVSWGLHWNRLWPHFALQHQKGWLEKGCGEVKFSRIHYLLWGRDYTAPFRHLAANGIVLDSSYGPNRGKGYLFGTGLPFHIIDKNGLPLEMWEWPLVAQEYWSGVNSEYIDNLLRKSSHEFHQAPVLLLHPNRWLLAPGGKEYLRSVVASARRYKHWIANFGGYWEFMQNRARATLCSSLKADSLQASLFAPQEGMGIVLPFKVSNIRVNGVKAEKRALRLNGTNHWLVAVPAGHSTLSADLPEQNAEPPE